MKVVRYISHHNGVFPILHPLPRLNPAGFGRLTPDARQGVPSRLPCALIFTVLVATACSDVLPSASSPDVPTATVVGFQDLDAAEFENRYIVRLHDDTEDVRARAESLAAERSGEVRNTIETVFRGFVVELPSTEEAERLARSPDVLYVEPDVLLELASPEFTVLGSEQTNPGWALDRVDQRSWSLDQKYRYQHTGDGVHLYVIDTGIQDIPGEFGNRLDPQAWISTSAALKCSPDPYVDDFGHGTQVAAVAAGQNYGVAKDVSIHSVKTDACDDGKFLTSEVVTAMDWIAEEHETPAVVNYSGKATDPFSPWERSRADAMAGLIAAGVTVVKAAGNDDVDACDDEGNQVQDAIVVGAVDSSGERSVWDADKASNWGACVSIFAPGTSVATINPSGSQEYQSGTSVAAPMVAGTAALALEANPTGSPSFVRADIEQSATMDSLATGTLNGSPNRLLHSLRTRTWIDGYSRIEQPGQYTWTANPSGGHGSYTWSHEWFESVNNGPYTSIGTGASVDITFSVAYCATHKLRLESTYGSETVSDVMVIQVENEPCPI
ncbi:MAG: S8 family peptidase [Gemmatimonadales bacterium]|nr:MAG: S8 family peptidase [Gemmatimonadales bacterium]